MKRRARDLQAGDRIQIFDIDVTLEQVHKFEAVEMGAGAFLPPCVLLIFNGQSLSIDPNDKFKLCA